MSDIQPRRYSQLTEEQLIQVRTKLVELGHEVFAFSMIDYYCFIKDLTTVDAAVEQIHRSVATIERRSR